MRLTPKELADVSKGKFWYLASPYSKWPLGPDDACETVAALAGRLISQGLPTFSPIAHSHCCALSADIPHDSYDIWLPYDRVMVANAAGIIVASMAGWDTSYGVGQELHWARTAGQPIYLLESVNLTLQAML